MSTPVLATKLFVPARRPHLVSRGRLTAQLDAQRVTLISAPAGFGKTTLVSDWIEHTDRRVERGEAATLHDAAGRWYEQHELFEDAIAHALAAGDHDRAGRLMELAIPEIRRTRRIATLFGWLQALPEEEVRRRPVLIVYSGFMLMVAGDLDGATARLDEAERALASPGTSWAETDELRTLPMMIAMYRSSLAQARGDVAGTTHAQRTIELAGPDDHFARAAGAGFLGLAAWAEGDVRAALETFSQAATSLHAAGNLVDELGTTVPLADMWTVSGRPSRARRLLQEALETAGQALPSGDLHVTSRRAAVRRARDHGLL